MRGPDAEGGPLAVLPYNVSDGASNMAYDEAMMAHARASGDTLLRFYGWDPACLSLGRNQAAPAGWRARDDLEIGTHVVRRPTGGRSVYHGPEVTYAIAAPDRAWGGPRALYARVHRSLADGLTRLGVRLDGSEATLVDAPDLSPTAAACFRDPAPGELTVAGKKLVGSAQWRSSGALIQHGSILLQNEQARSDLRDPVAAAALIGGTSAGPSVAEPDATSLSEVLDSSPPLETVLESLRQGFLSTWDETVVLGADDCRISDLKRTLECHVATYRDPDRFWRSDIGDQIFESS